MLGDVALRHRQRIGGDVNGVNIGIGEIVCEENRKTSGAGA